MSTEVPLGKAGGLTVNVGVIIGVCGSGVGVTSVAVAIISEGVAVHGIAVCVPAGRNEFVWVGDGVMVTGMLVDVPVGVGGVNSADGDD